MAMIMSDRPVTQEGLLDWVNRQCSPIVRRLARDLEATLAIAKTPQTLAGEVTGTTAASVVAKLQGLVLDVVAPTVVGQTLYFDGTKWVS